MKTVIDSDIFIDYLRSYPLSKRFFEELEPGKVLFSAVTEAELLSGKDCNDETSMNETLRLLNAYTKIEVTNEIAKKAGELRRVFGIQMQDALIAATAMLNNAKLATRNVRDFQRIKGLMIQKPYG